MASRIYLESALRDHPRARAWLARQPRTPVIEIERYGEAFNPRAQNFRLQKKNPALIIARKTGKAVLQAPEGYGLAGEHHYYFSHMLNCVYDCRYCFLQGMYRSAHQVLFANFEDFGAAIEAVAAEHAGEPVWFYSGYDCDSLASDPLTGFSDYFLPLITGIDNAWLELRTKSTQVRGLLRREPHPRVVTAFSFTDEHSHRQLEHGVPSTEKRLDAMRRLLDAGWPVGLRLDPVVYHRDYRDAFSRLLDTVFERIAAERLHSVSLGAFRLTRDHYRRIVRLYPDEPLLAQPLALASGIVSYPRQMEEEMIGYCRSRLLEYVPERIFQPCEWHD